MLYLIRAALLLSLGLQWTAFSMVQEPDDPGPPTLKRGKPAEKKAPAKPAAKQPKPPTAPAASGTAAPAAPAAESAVPPKSASPASSDRGAAQPVATVPVDPKNELLNRARDATYSFTEKLPNYYCQQFTTRFFSNTNPPNWRAEDVVSTTVIYEDGREQYRNIQINGRPAAQKMEQLPGAWSTGEFGTILNNIFATATAADFRFRNQSTASGRPASVYDFDVTKANSAWEVRSNNQLILPAYHGSIWIDKESARVLRIEMQAVRMPESFPLDTVELSVDYDFVRIGTQNYLLPARTENLSCQRGSSMCSRNVTDFRNYRKYSAESTITFPQ